MTKKKNTELVLHLFHGRHTPDEELDDWGFDGPFLRIAGYHCTYFDDVKVQPVEGEEWESFEQKNALLHYAGKWYGDWSVMAATLCTESIPLDVEKMKIQEKTPRYKLTENPCSLYQYQIMDAQMERIISVHQYLSDAKMVCARLNGQAFEPAMMDTMTLERALEVMENTIRAVGDESSPLYGVFGPMELLAIDKLVEQARKA